MLPDLVIKETRHAPDGWVWLCLACGKKSKDRYGDPDTSWDEACFLNSVLLEGERSDLVSLTGKKLIVVSN